MLGVGGKRGAWAAQLVEDPTSAQVMASQFVSLCPVWGSLLSMQKPLQILCPPLSLPLPHSHTLSPQNKQTFIKKKERKEGRKEGRKERTLLDPGQKAQEERENEEKYS